MKTLAGFTLLLALAGWSVNAAESAYEKGQEALRMKDWGAAVALWSYSQTRTDRDRHAEPPEPETDAAGDADPDDLPN